MIFATPLALLLLPALVVAQYGGTPTTSSAVSVPSAPANTAGHINVGPFPCHPNFFVRSPLFLQIRLMLLTIRHLYFIQLISLRQMEPLSHSSFLRPYFVIVCSTEHRLISSSSCYRGFAHSVTQSSFDSPCTHLAASGGNPAGFDSGLTQSSHFSITITNDAERTFHFLTISPIYLLETSTAIYYHCKQTLHCGQGMVG